MIYEGYNIYTHTIQRWHLPAVYYALRLAVAPAIESILLLDRLLFLRQVNLNIEN
jgi:hypothetical protein